MYGKLRFFPEMQFRSWLEMRDSLRARDIASSEVDEALAALDFFESELGTNWEALIVGGPLASTIAIKGQRELEAVRLARLALSLPPGPARSQLVRELGA